VGSEGDFYIDLGTTTFYGPKTGTAWGIGLSLRGPQGPTGAAGPQGDTGAQGPQGLKGDTGAQGLKGDTGPQGLKGDTGAQGPQGLKGDTGAQGPQGLKGDTGAQGLKGDTGAQGLKGDTGAQGPQGLKGDTGAQGPQGLKGDTGAQGPPGLDGPQGPVGQPGPEGPAGQPGGGVTIEQLYPGTSDPSSDPNSHPCPYGGTKFTDAAGNVSYACSANPYYVPPPTIEPVMFEADTFESAIPIPSSTYDWATDTHPQTLMFTLGAVPADSTITFNLQFTLGFACSPWHPSCFFSTVREEPQDYGVQVALCYRVYQTIGDVENLLDIAFDSFPSITDPDKGFRWGHHFELNLETGKGVSRDSYAHFALNGAGRTYGGDFSYIEYGVCMSATPGNIEALDASYIELITARVSGSVSYTDYSSQY
jgi:hypothetical protein